MCERSLDVILELLRARNVLEEDLEDHVLMLREKEQMITKRLVEYYLNNIGLDGTDGEVVRWVEEDASFCYSSSTPLKTR
nr:zinc finger, GRF-type [Tanacetum cinerariifolium]